MNEYLSNAETAYSNKQYAEALSWYIKFLNETPDDIYALSRAGAICVPLGKFEDALKYFGRAKKLDPNNGDNLFNYGNACFFNRDYTKAFSEYVEAEKIGCSDDVTPRLYYQMALLCSMRQDVRSALVYFQKCEAADKEGLIAINPDLISEKMKLYMSTQDFENAEKCAAQLVAIQPTNFRNYMVYFSILMAHKNYAIAEKVLSDAEEYSELTDEYKFTLMLQKASLLVAIGEADSRQTETTFAKAIELLESQLHSSALSDDQNKQLILTLSEIYLKDAQYDKAISLLGSILNSGTVKPIEIEKVAPIHELSSEEIEELIREDMKRIQEKIDTGEIDGDMGAYATIEYDEEGNERHVYDDDVFSSLDSAPKQNEERSETSVGGTPDVSVSFRERIHFTLLSAFLGKEDFENAAKIANILKHSDNKYYNYYGIYTSALCELKLGRPAELVDRKYAEAIAFFRTKTFSDPTDSLAVIFRARLYAEQGKVEKAKEIANLLSETDKEAVLQYVEQCKMV